MKPSSRWLPIFLLAAGILLVAASLSFLSEETMTNAPDDYKKVCQVSLEEEYSQSLIYSFQLPQDQMLGIYTWTSNKTYKEIVLVGKKGMRIDLAKSKDITGGGKFTVPADDYQILLTSREATGNLYVYIRK